MLSAVKYDVSLKWPFFLVMILVPDIICGQDQTGFRIFLPDTVMTTGAFLDYVQEKTQLSVTYNTGVIDRKKTLKIKAEEGPLTEILAKILDDPSLDFKAVGRHLVIYRPLLSVSADPAGKDSVYFFEIRGRIFDKATRQPLAFANVFLTGKSIGTISNNDGEFVLKLDSKSLADTFNISFIGYKSVTEPVASLVNTEKNYFLETEVISLQEVIIRKITHQNILESFITHIPDNYSRKPAILSSFYRETVRKGNRYMMVSEALLDIFSQPYDGRLTPDQVKIVRGRNRQDVNPDDSLALRLKAGLNSMLLLDVVKNIPSFIIDQEKYSYIFSDIVVEDGKENFAVDFSPSPYAPDALFSGRIFIDIDDYSLKRVEFSIDPSKLEEATRLFVLKKPPTVNVNLISASYEVSFRSVNKVYYLHHISSNVGFRIKWKKQLSAANYYTALEMVVTGIDTLNVQRFDSRETARTKDFLNTQVRGYNEAFWGEFNYIKPEDPLEKAIGKLTETEWNIQ